MLKQITRSFFSRPVTINGPQASDDALKELAGKVDAPSTKRLGRSRAIDAGSCNGCELEIHALDNRSTTSNASWPRHAMLTCCWSQDP